MHSFDRADCLVHRLFRVPRRAQRVLHLLIPQQHDKRGKAVEDVQASEVYAR